jgi:hypothetical protein
MYMIRHRDSQKAKANHYLTITYRNKPWLIRELGPKSKIIKQINNGEYVKRLSEESS